VSKRELTALYARRWHIELDIRNIKTTLGHGGAALFDTCDGGERAVVCLLAYNLIRLLMAQAATPRCVPARIVLQAHRADVEQLAQQCRTRRTLSAHRTAPGGQPTRPQ